MIQSGGGFPAVPLPDGAGDVGFRVRHGLRERLALCKACGDGGREGAAGAVRFGIFTKRSAKGFEPARRRENVGGDRGFEMPTLQEKGAAVALNQCRTGLLDFGEVATGHAREDAKFVEIRSDERGERKKQTPIGSDRGRLQKRIAAGSHHHGIDHEWNAAFGFSQNLGHSADDRGRVEHPGFHGGDGECLEAHSDLFGDDFRANGLDRRNTTGHLGHHASHRRLRIGTEGGNRFEISLNARAAGIVRTGDREDDGRCSTQPGEA